MNLTDLRQESLRQPRFRFCSNCGRFGPAAVIVLLLPVPRGCHWYCTLDCASREGV